MLGPGARTLNDLVAPGPSIHVGDLRRDRRDLFAYPEGRA